MVICCIKSEKSYNSMKENEYDRKIFTALFYSEKFKSVCVGNAISCVPTSLR